MAGMGKTFWRLAVSQAVPADSRRVTVAFSFIGEHIVFGSMNDEAHGKFWLLHNENSVMYTGYLVVLGKCSPGMCGGYDMLLESYR